MPLPFLFTNFTAAARKPALIPFNYFGPNDSVAFIQGIGGVVPSSVSFDAQCNGVTTVFTLPAAATALVVFWNGLSQEGGGVDYNFTSGTNTFTMLLAPATGDHLVAYYS